MEGASEATWMRHPAKGGVPLAQERDRLVLHPELGVPAVELLVKEVAHERLCRVRLAK